jgi:hemolysin activation/secretion protein
LAACLSAPNAIALTPAEIAAGQQQAEQLQREEQQRLREQTRRDLELKKPRTQLPAPVVVAPERGVGACRDIREVRIKGATLLKAERINLIAAVYAKRCLGVGDIEKLLADLTNAYIAAGYISVRAYLPQQDLSTGILEILVIEGKVEKIQINDAGKGSVSVGNVAPGLIGSPLNLRDFEQTLDQINRLASNNATFDIQPGSQPGDSVVVINNSPARPWRVGLTYDNQGSASTGKEQAGLNLSWDNLLGLDDFVSVTHRRANPYYAGREASWSNSLTYVVPFGYTTATLSLSDSAYASLLTPASGAILHSRGTSNQVALRLDHVLYRNQTSRWNLAAGLTTKESENYLEGILLGVSSRRLTPLDIDSSYTTGFAGGALTLDFGYARGLKLLNALDDASGLPSVSPRAQFGKWKYGGNYNLPFKAGELNWSFTSALTAQKSESVLYGSEQISIGGIYSVRGFVRNSLSGDDGYYLRNDLGVRIPFAGPGGHAGTLRPYLALDHGRVSNRVAGVPSGSLTGMAAGFSLILGSVSLDLFHAIGLNEPSSMLHEGGATFFRLSATL